MNPNIFDDRETKQENHRERYGWGKFTVTGEERSIKYVAWKTTFTGRELHSRVTTDGRDTFITLMEARIFEESNGKCKECNFKEYELTLNS